ncbi:MAG TPA: response regulator [Desulfomonilaceae bacterium]|nr:response regulator [Desulfomonilaceae bacterium]
MDVLTVYQASKYCSVTPKTICNWVDEGHIKAFRTVGGHRRIRREDLEAFLRRMNIPFAAEVAEDERKRILVIDDDKLIVETIVRSLEEEPHDYEIISAADGFEAGLQVSHFKPDLMILDIMMPDIDGYEVCKRVKQDPMTCGMKVIVLSAYLDEENYEKMKNYGADVCFSKPLPLEKLKKEVADLLELTE